ncbi:MAG: hydroxyacid dehydrogenase [Acidithiobacillus sp.]|nr:MAG: hydroxyacid dehydrogenase [Acidithiobacillus sp.]
MQKTINLVIHGVASADEIPGIDRISSDAQITCAPDLKSLQRYLAGAEVLLGWNFRATELREAWGPANRLRWVRWSGAGVDAVLFPEFVASDVQLTNVRGVFDRAMAEYTLGLILAFAKRLPETVAAQTEHRWSYRLTEQTLGQKVLVVGVGSIGRAIGRLLKQTGFKVSGVGRSARDSDPDFEQVYAVDTLVQSLETADYVVLIPPLTDQTRGLFGATEFSAMKSTARFINLGRGELVDEEALIAALTSGAIAGAGLDVFLNEPLPENSPFWDLENVIVSPHMSGDYHGFKETVAEVFLDNFERYRQGRELVNRVDKTLGFVNT